MNTTSRMQGYIVECIPKSSIRRIIRKIGRGVHGIDFDLRY